MDDAFESLRGHEALLFFWASWCGACESGMQALADRNAQGQSTPIIIGISLDESADDAEEYLRGQRFGDYQVHDGGWFGEWSRAFQVYRRGIPWSVLVGSDGTIQEMGPLPTVLAAAR